MGNLIAIPIIGGLIAAIYHFLIPKPLPIQQPVSLTTPTTSTSSTPTLSTKTPSSLSSTTSTTSTSTSTTSTSTTSTTSTSTTSTTSTSTTSTTSRLDKPKKQEPASSLPLKTTTTTTKPTSSTSKTQMTSSSTPKTGTAALLQWCQNRVQPYGLTVKDFTKSWTDGMVFCAIIHSYEPSLIDFKSLSPENKVSNIRLAFDAAAKLNIDQLLDPEDFAIEKLSMITYISVVYRQLVNKGR